MSDIPISGLPETIVLDDEDAIEVSRDLTGTPFSRRASIGTVRAKLQGDIQGNFPPEYLRDRHSPITTPVWADEFSPASPWTTITTSGTLSVLFDRGVCSMKFNGQATSDLVGIGQPLPALDPAVTVFAVETSYRVWTYRANYLMAGPFVSGGLDAASNTTWFMPYWGNDSFVDSLRTGTITNVATNHGDATRYPYGAMGVDTNLCRLIIDKADNSIRVERSLDGVQWTLAGSTAFDRVLTFTPTHFGFGVSSWAGNSSPSWDRLCSIDYMRIYDLT